MSRHFRFVVVLLACYLSTGVASAAGFFGMTATPAALTPATIVSSPEKKVVDTEGAGKLYTVGARTVCVVAGTPTEMGRQYGRLLAPRIHKMVVEGYVAHTLYGEGYSREYVNTQAARMEKHFLPAYVEELHGVVEGLHAAGVDDISYEDLRNVLAMPEIQHHKPDAPPACSNFAVFGKWTPDGRLLHGRNLDWNIEDGGQEGAVIVVWCPKGGFPFMMPTWAGLIGGVGGMNAKGITIGEMTSTTPDETFDGLPLVLTIRRVLESAQTLDEAVAVVRDSPHTLGWNYVIGDGKIPDARALEVDAKDVAVFTPNDAKESAETAHWALKDAVRRTNHPCGLLHFIKAGKLVGEEKGLDLSNMDTARLVIMQAESWKRYDWLGRQIAAHPATIDVPTALELLSNGPVKVDNTLQSWVADPKNNLFYIAVADLNPPVTATSMPYTAIDLTEWFK